MRARARYTGQLTIAAENDIIIDDNVCAALRATGMLGLIANNFVRVYQPVPTQTARGQLRRRLERQRRRSTNLRIDAAMLAIQHSFIVDHYDCGATLGTLTVNGAIGQKFRGAVGTFGGSTRSRATSRTTTTTIACATSRRRTSSTRSSRPGTSSARPWTSPRPRPERQGFAGAASNDPRMAAIAVALFVLGAVVGSFVTVVAHRLPRGESFVGGRSRCPELRRRRSRPATTSRSSPGSGCAAAAATAASRSRRATRSPRPASGRSGPPPT